MTRTQKVKARPHNRHMSPASQVHQKLLLKRRRKLIRKLKQNLTLTQTIQTQILKTLMKRRKRKEERQRKLNLLQKLYLSRLLHQKLFHQSFKHQQYCQYKHRFNKFSRRQYRKLILCSIFFRVYQLKHSPQSNWLQLHISDSFNRPNSKFTNSSRKQQHLGALG